jgi:hypothetical protein
MPKDPFVCDECQQEGEHGATYHGKVMADVRGKPEGQTRITSKQKPKVKAEPAPGTATAHKYKGQGRILSAALRASRTNEMLCHILSAIVIRGYQLETIEPHRSAKI